MCGVGGFGGDEVEVSYKLLTPCVLRQRKVNKISVRLNYNCNLQNASLYMILTSYGNLVSKSASGIFSAHRHHDNSLSASTVPLSAMIFNQVEGDLAKSSR
jgi:hypothetical protein